MKKSPFYLALAFAALCVFANCSKDDDGACGAGSFNETHSIAPHQDPFTFQQNLLGAVQPNVIYYNYAHTGKVQFFMGHSWVNICPEEHVKAKYTFFALNDQPNDSVLFKIYGEAYWSIFGDEIILIQNGALPGSQGTSMEVGLKQAFPDGPGDLDLYLNVEFDTRGSFAADSAIFMNYFSLLEVGLEGDYYI